MGSPSSLGLEAAAEKVEVDKKERRAKQHQRNHHNPASQVTHIACKATSHVYHERPIRSHKVPADSPLMISATPTAMPLKPANYTIMTCRRDCAIAQHTCGLNTAGSGHEGPGERVPPTTVAYLDDQNACSSPAQVTCNTTHP